MIEIKINNILNDLYRHKSDIESVISNSIQELFEQESDPYGAKWKPRKDTFKHPILNKTGLMKSSITYISKLYGGIMIVEEQDNTEYGKWHQFGTSKMPSRKFLGMSTNMINELQRVIYGM